ncbi:hypothetical protein D3C78_1751720 [compost metagenome]
MQAAPLQALVGHAGERQVAQAVLALVVGRAVVAYVADIEQAGDADAVVLFQRRPEQPADQ